MFAGQSGLENTSFALLDPDGKKITRGSRSPSNHYKDNEAFVAALDKTAAKYEKKAKSIEALPVLRDLRIALNVAAADMRPLVVVRGKDKKHADSLAKGVAKESWGQDMVGMCHFVVLEDEATFEGLTPKVGVSVIQPDPYGLGGTILSHEGSGSKSSAVRGALSAGIKKHQADAREHDDHIREARRRGISWESEIPVTDSAAERSGRKRRGRRGKDDDSDK